MEYEHAKKLLAITQYERITKRKWDKATDHDRALWLDGAEADLAALEIRSPAAWNTKNAILPRTLDKEDAQLFLTAFENHLALSRGLGETAVLAYNEFVKGK